MVHKAKPTVCAMYPLGRCIALTPDILDKIESTDLKPQYFLTEVACGDKTETHTVRDWLCSFGIPVEDAYYIRWNRIAMRASKIIKGVEGTWSTHGLNMLLTLIFNTLYLGYDMDQAFDPQFEERSEKLHEILNTIDPGAGDNANEG